MQDKSPDFIAFYMKKKISEGLEPLAVRNIRSIQITSMNNITRHFRLQLQTCIEECIRNF